MPTPRKLLFIFLPAFAIVAALVWPASLLVQADMKLRVLAALTGFGQPGLAVSVEGRNVLLSGRANQPQALLQARQGLAGLPGVRILLVSAEVDSPAFQPEPIETAPIEPVSVSYLINDEPTRPEPAVALPRLAPRIVAVPAARQIPQPVPVCPQLAVQMHGRRDAAQGPGVPVCRPQISNLSPAE